jgi:hypothetical protein
MRYLAIFLFLLPFYANAQNAGDEMKVKNGSDITKSLKYSDRFSYPSFLDGKVYFRNGRVVNAKLNYSLPHGEVQFVDAKKDTLILNDKNFIDKITIAADTFYYYQHHGHVRKVAGYNRVSLAEKQILGTNGVERYAAYNQYSSTSAISTYSSFVNSNGQPQTLEGSDRIALKKRFVYFFLDQNRDIYLATKGNLVKVFPRHKKALHTYFKENKVEFANPEEIVKTLEFASSL